jgi:hypothetical protein
MIIFGLKKIILIKLLHNFLAENLAKTKVFTKTYAQTFCENENFREPKFLENLLIFVYFWLLAKMKKSVFVSTLVSNWLYFLLTVMFLIFDFQRV